MTIQNTKHKTSYLKSNLISNHTFRVLHSEREAVDTGKKIIVESGRDNYYGCGLSFTNKNILDRKSYTGKNKLGVFLMERRDSLR